MTTVKDDVSKLGDLVYKLRDEKERLKDCVEEDVLKTLSDLDRVVNAQAFQHIAEVYDNFCMRKEFFGSYYGSSGVGMPETVAAAPDSGAVGSRISTRRASTYGAERRASAQVSGSSLTAQNGKRVTVVGNAVVEDVAASEIRIIVLDKSKSKDLGFNIVGRKKANVIAATSDDRILPTGIFISRISQGGLAYQDGRLKVGDELLTINGLSLYGMSYEDTAGMLINSSGNIALGVVSNKKGFSNFVSNMKKNQSISKKEHLFRVRAVVDYSRQDGDPDTPNYEGALRFAKGAIIDIIDDSTYQLWWIAKVIEDKTTGWNVGKRGFIPSSTQMRNNSNEKGLHVKFEPSVDLFIQTGLLNADDVPQFEGFKRSRSIEFRRAVKNKVTLEHIEKEDSGKGKEPTSILVPHTPTMRQRTLSDLRFAGEDSHWLGYQYICQKENVFPKYVRPLFVLGAAADMVVEVALGLYSSDFCTPVPFTTRPKSKNEKDGVDFYYESKAQFSEMMEQGEFAEVGQYENHLYGVTVESIRSLSAPKSGEVKRVIVDGHPKALKTMCLEGLDPIVIMLLPTVENCEAGGTSSRTSCKSLDPEIDDISIDNVVSEEHLSSKMAHAHADGNVSKLKEKLNNTLTDDNVELGDYYNIGLHDYDLANQVESELEYAIDKVFYLNNDVESLIESIILFLEGAEEESEYVAVVKSPVPVGGT
eukprot:Nk52_evm15s1992 gene=Nk52_evmTU15s1992